MIGSYLAFVWVWLSVPRRVTDAKSIDFIDKAGKGFAWANRNMAPIQRILPLDLTSLAVQ